MKQQLSSSCCFYKNSLRTSAVKQQLSSSCCFVRATAVTWYLLRAVLSGQQQLSSPCWFACATGRLFFFSTYSVPLTIGRCSFPFRSIDLFASRSSEHLSFVLLCLFVFFFSFLLFFCPFFLFLLWSGLLCCVLVPGTLALDLPYLDELRLFGSLCFTVVCDHIKISCISLG